jgi:hypothetical protein
MVAITEVAEHQQVKPGSEPGTLSGDINKRQNVEARRSPVSEDSALLLDSGQCSGKARATPPAATALV